MKLTTFERSLRQDLLARISNRFRHHVEACMDLRAATNDPLHAAYLAPEGPFVVNVPAADCRGLHSVAFPMLADGDHPFIRTVREIDNGLRDYDTSALRDYYRQFRPATAAEALGVPLAKAHPELMRPPLAATLPWDFRSPEQAQEFWTLICEQDYRRHGFALSYTDGWKAWGPLSDLAGAAEFTRLLRATTSIRAHGYRRHSAGDGDIQGSILRHGNDTRFMLNAGQHRAAVLTALGQAHLPVRLTSSIVNRDEVDHWPNVRRGIFSRELALQVFDRVFAGRQPFGETPPRTKP